MWGEKKTIKVTPTWKQISSALINGRLFLASDCLMALWLTDTEMDLATDRLSVGESRPWINKNQACIADQCWLQVCWSFQHTEKSERKCYSYKRGNLTMDRIISHLGRVSCRLSVPQLFFTYRCIHVDVYRGPKHQLCKLRTHTAVRYIEWAWRNLQPDQKTPQAMPLRRRGIV